MHCYFLGLFALVFSSIAHASFQYDFCSGGSTRLWSRYKIDKEIDSLIAHKDIRNTSKVAYPVIYKYMTEDRDKRRCQGGSLESEVFVSNLIGHLLADTMTRFLVKETARCAPQPSLSKKKLYGICGVSQRLSKNARFDMISGAMLSTSVYISSHIALSLSAIVFDDRFWNSLYGVQQAHGSALDKEVAGERIRLIKKFRPTFDLYNAFLAGSLLLVEKSLTDYGLISGHHLRSAASLSNNSPIVRGVFRSIRSLAFNEALDLAQKWQPTDHPMIGARRGEFTISDGIFQKDFVYPSSLIRLENRAVLRLANPGMRFIYRHILGGKL